MLPRAAMDEIKKAHERIVDLTSALDNAIADGKDSVALRCGEVVPDGRAAMVYVEQKCKRALRSANATVAAVSKFQKKCP